MASVSQFGRVFWPSIGQSEPASTLKRCTGPVNSSRTEESATFIVIETPKVRSVCVGVGAALSVFSRSLTKAQGLNKCTERVQL